MKSQSLFNSEIISIKKEDLKFAISAVAANKKIDSLLLEKDIWNTVFLKYLFEYSLYKEEHVFKGGTSLMKAYGVIKRFSEDLDLFFNWNLIGRNDEQMLMLTFLQETRRKNLLKRQISYLMSLLKN